MSMGAAYTPAQLERLRNVVARIERIPFSGWHVRVRVIVGVATFFDGFDSLMLAAILPVLFRLWHLRPEQVGVLLSAGYIGQAAGAVFFGWVAERFGRMKSLIATVGLYALMSVGCAISWNFNSLFFFRVIQGVGLGGEIPIAASYISEFSRAKGRGRFVLLYECTMVIGVVISSLTSMVVIPHFGWRPMFYIGAVPAILALLLRWIVPESPRWLAEKGRMDEAEKVVARIEDAASHHGKIKLPPVVPVVIATRDARTRWSELFSPAYLKRTIVIWTAYFASYFVGQGFGVWAPTLFIQVFKVPLQTALRYNFYFSIDILIGTIICALLVDKVGRKLWFSASFILGGMLLLCIWLFNARSENIVLYFGVSAHGLIAMTSTALFLYAPEVYPTRLRALGASLGSAWQRFGTLIAPLILGFIVGRSHLANGFLMFGLIIIVSGIIIWLLGVETKGRVLEEISP